MIARPLFIAPLIVLVGALAGCTPGSATPTPSPSISSVPLASPADSPSPSATASDDSLLLISATAHTASGAQLALSMRVHRPVSFFDSAVASRRSLIEAICGAGHNQNWADLVGETAAGLEVIDVTATSIGSTPWPANAEITLTPADPGFHPMAAQGAGITFTIANRNDAPDAGSCFQPLSIYGAAAGQLNVYMYPRTDVSEPVPSPNYYLWFTQVYGFGAPGGLSVTLSDCTSTITDAGRAFGWTDANWMQVNDPTSCSAGPFGD